jgi:hypothetical protein
MTISTHTDPEKNDEKCDCKTSKQARFKQQQIGG